MVPEAYPEQSGRSDGALCVNSERLKMFFSKSFILDVGLRPEYTSGTANYVAKNCILNL